MHWLVHIAIPIAAALSSLYCSGALAQRAETGAPIAQDRFVSGRQALVSEPVQGDLFAAGREVEIASSATGDVLAAGRLVRMTGTAHQDLYAAGGDVRIAGAIDHNARIAGRSVLLDQNSSVDGNASIAGRNVNAVGSVGGHLQLAGDRLFVNGPIRGDVFARGGRIELGPKAEIGGTLRYRSDTDLIQAPGARIAGGVERIPTDDQAGGPIRSWGFWAWGVGFIALGVALVAFLPRFSHRVSETAQFRFGRSLLVGIATLVLVPIAAAAAAITIVGLPISAVLLLTYLTLLFVGYVLAGVALGDASLRRLRRQRQDSRGWRIVGATMGLLLLALLNAVPIVGGVVALLALIIGIGALLTQFRTGTAEVA